MNTLTPTLDFVVFYVAELDRALDFFTGKLGFGRMEEGDGPDFRQIRNGDGTSNFGLSLASPQTPPPGTVVVYFKTEDLEGLREAVTGRGVEASPISVKPFGATFNVTSPDQIPLALFKEPV